MKAIYVCFSILIFSAALFTGCKKYDEESFNFSPSLPPYLALKSYDDVTTKQDSTLSFSVLVRTALQEPVVVNYKITGDFTLSGTYTLPRNTVEGVITIAIPAGIVPVGSANVTGILSLTGAARAGGSITVGRISPDNEKFLVTVNP